MKLYDTRFSGNCYKVRLILNQIGQAYEHFDIDIFEGESRTPDFLKKNPNGRVPVLELDNGLCLAESNAILFYLAEGTPLLPAERLERAEMLQWMFFEQYNHEPNIAVARALTLFAPATEENTSVIKEKQEKGYDALDVMEGHLKAREYIAGANYSIADIALYAYTHVAHEGGFDMTRFENIRGWLERVKDQPDHISISHGYAAAS